MKGWYLDNVYEWLVARIGVDATENGTFAKAQGKKRLGNLCKTDFDQTQDPLDRRVKDRLAVMGATPASDLGTQAPQAMG